jgi:carbon-monoxide dehydrogenase medium subunit
MKPAPFKYVQPKTIHEAISLLSQHDGFAKVLAGGQTLGPMMSLRLVQPDLVVDISRVGELKNVSSIQGSIRLGAGVTHAQIEDGRVPDVANGLLSHIAGGIAYRAIRNRGTLGGSLAHADPAAEWPSVVTALNGEIRLRGPNGSRRDVTADEFMVAPLTTLLAKDELIESILIRNLSRSARTSFRKFCRKEGEFAHALSVVVVDREQGRFRAVLGGASAKPLLMATVGNALARTKSANDDSLREAIRADIDSAGIGEDEYDRHLYATIMLRTAKECVQ